MKKKIGRPRTETGPTTKTSTRLPVEMWTRLRMLALERHTTARALVAEAVEALLKGAGR